MNFSAENVQLWNFIIQMGILCTLLLFANILRTKISVIQKSLMPTAVLAGFILLGLRLIKIIPINTDFLEIVTYHGIALGFIALSLRKNEHSTIELNKTRFLSLKNGALIVSTYLVQAITGLVISLLLVYTIRPDFFAASGVLLPMGYGQGPGQANNIGASYEAMGFVGGRSYGLAIAAAGFLVACIVGVIYLNVKRIKIQAEHVSGSITVDVFQDKNEIPVAESVDKLSVQVALVMVIYMISYIFMHGVTFFIGKYVTGLNELLSPLIWGFNFIIGAGMALLAKMILNTLRKHNIMHRQYQNNYLLGRIAGFAFDLMIIAGIGSINMYDLRGLWLPFVITIVVGGIVTFLYLHFITKRLYHDYSTEGFISMFGMLTGTISSGILLLREIDPSYKTPAANNLITGSSVAIIFAIPVLLLIGLAPKSAIMPFVVVGIASVYLVVLLFIILKLGKKKS